MMHEANQVNLAGPIRETTLGSMNYHVLRTIIEDQKILKLQRGAEIGVLYGDTSCYLLSKFPHLTLFCVDPYQGYNEPGSDRTDQTLAQYEKAAHEKCRPYGSRAQFMKAFSVEAAKVIPDQSLDFVFIDALHTYEAVRDDLLAWYSKVRGNGLVAGHDYRWKGVTKAVDEFAVAHGINGHCTTATSDIWFFIKPPGNN